MISNITTENASGLAISPMWTVRGLVSLLGANEDRVLQFIKLGKILWAWDLGLGIRNREVRVLPRAVEHFQSGNECALSWEDIQQMLAPETIGAQPGVIATVSSLHIQQTCNLSGSHVAALGEARQLDIIRPGRPGAGGSAAISANSFWQFLKKRRLR